MLNGVCGAQGSAVSKRLENIMATHTLVTGGAGFIGSHLVSALVRAGERVRVLDNFSTGFRRNLDEVAGNVEIIEGDLRDEDACSRACARIETVYHLAALNSVARSVESPLATDAVNVGGTLRLLTAAKERGARRFVFSSSSSVYGNASNPVKHEELRPAPLSPYAASKLAGEAYCRVFHECYGLETISLRYFNVFGPRQNPNSAYAAVIPRFLDALCAHRLPILYGDGRQTRDFTYVANVVEANRLAGRSASWGGEAFNIACGERIAVRHVLDRIAALLEKSADCEYRPRRAGDIEHSLASVEKARLGLGYAPLVGFEDGLRRTVENFLQRAGAAPNDSLLHEPVLCR